MTTVMYNCAACGAPINATPKVLRKRLRVSKSGTLYCNTACFGSVCRKTDDAKAKATSRSRTYLAWTGMLGRTRRKDHPKAHLYALKGIGCDPAWLDYRGFLSDMGEKPPGLTLDRIDGNKGYYKDNCRWATYATQSRNRSDNVWVEVHGIKMIVKDAVTKLGYAYQSFTMLRRRLEPQEVIDYWIANPKKVSTPWSDDEIEALRDLAKSGCSIGDAAMKLERSAEAISHKISVLGIKWEVSSVRLSEACRQREARKRAARANPTA